MVCSGCIRNVIVQAGHIGQSAVRSVRLRAIYRSLNANIGLRYTWNRQFRSSVKMMVDTAKGEPIINVLPEKEDDGGYASGGWKGHGGSRAAEFLKEHLFENLMKHPEFMTNTKLAISETYQQTDMNFLDAERDTYRDDGSTASTAVLVGNHLYVANVGDSRAVISKAGKAIPLSEDHKPNRSDERKRIENAGGVVMWAGTWRVGGVLAMSRAFGNRMLKQYVVAEPEIQDQEVDEELELLVLASDGLWDVVPNEDAIALARTEEEPEAGARKLTETAFTRGSADNITCIVVRFHHEKVDPDPPNMEQA
uniref:PPM-type phosphatase domain-containing protein n=1 Tax=Vitis vinifera TaxID=29760 RepID=A5BAC4_VITVI|nr:hypothetical protein VITISV_021634 [Vitis vinifera]